MNFPDGHLVRYLLLEEVSEYPDDVDGRGDPVELAEARTTAYADIRKIAYISTPGIKGTCRVSEKYEASDQRRYYVRCPHCGAWQVLEFANLKWASDTPPHGAYFVCAAHGCVIEHAHKRAMVASGVWIKCWPDDDDPPPPWFEDDELERWPARGSGGREPGFHIWQAYSPFVSWDDTVTAWLKAKGDPFKVKVFTQQVLGEAYEETDEAPDWEKLY